MKELNFHFAMIVENFDSTKKKKWSSGETHTDFFPTAQTYSPTDHVLLTSYLGNVLAS
jgi:hypothetical protein